MDVYRLIERKLSEMKESKVILIPYSIEMNKETHNELVDNFKERTKSENILSIEKIFYLPIFINEKIKTGDFYIVTSKSKVDICLSCAEKYTNVKNSHLLKYSKDSLCVGCNVVCKTTKISSNHIDFDNIKSNKHPNN